MREFQKAGLACSGIDLSWPGYIFSDPMQLRSAVLQPIMQGVMEANRIRLSESLAGCDVNPSILRRPPRLAVGRRPRRLAAARAGHDASPTLFLQNSAECGRNCSNAVGGRVRVAHVDAAQNCIGRVLAPLQVSPSVWDQLRRSPASYIPWHSGSLFCINPVLARARMAHSAGLAGVGSSSRELSESGGFNQTVAG